MKGWEVYSWPCADTVCFALVPGTNRLKTADEIRKSPLALADLEKRITTLSRGDEVFWNAPDASFDVPTRGKRDPRNAAVMAFQKRGLKVTITR